MLKNFSFFLTSKHNKRGQLVLIGGAEDRTGKKLILSELIRRTQPKYLIIIPSASSYARSLGEDYYHAFRSLGIEKIEIIDFRSSDDAENKDLFEKFLSVDLVFFTGGDQVRLFNVIGNTSVHRIIKNRYLHDSLNVAGTSAGAAVMSNPMIYDGNNLGLIKGRVQFAEGMGLVDFTIDTHFVSRGRLARLTQFLCTGISVKGIGLGEDTALFINSDLTAEVIGSGMVTVVHAGNLHFNNYFDIPNNTPISIDGLRVGFLQHGTVFNLKSWMIEKASPVPLDEKLIELMEE